MSHGLTQMLQTMDGTNIEMRIAYQCAPLLAGLKPSNLLMLREREVTYVQWMLKQAGISYFIVAQEKGKAAVLLYNKGELQRYLAQEQVAGSLKKMGYRELSLGKVLYVFRRHYEAFLRGEAEFPHEMGFLLGYPVEDVEGFILHKGGSYLCNGYWKVYYNVSQKQRTFRWYSFAEHHLLCLLKEGRSIPEIIRLYQRPLGIVPA